MRHEFGFCSGPCAGFVTQWEYRRRVETAVAFLEGRTIQPIDRVVAAMQEAAAEARFEVAARWREKFEQLEWLLAATSRARSARGPAHFRLPRSRASSATTGSTSCARAWCAPRFPIPTTPIEHEAFRAVVAEEAAQPLPPAGPLPPESIDEILLLMSWFRAHPDALRRTTPYDELGCLSGTGATNPRASCPPQRTPRSDPRPVKLLVQYSDLPDCIFVASTRALPPRAAPLLRSHHSSAGGHDATSCSLGRRRRRPRPDDAAGRPALRRSLVRHHPLRRLHEVRQSGLRSTRHQRAQRRRRGLRRRGHARARPGLALVGNVAYSQPELEIGAPLIGGVSVGQSSVLLYDAGAPAPGAGRRAGCRSPRSCRAAPAQMRQSFDVGPAVDPLDRTSPTTSARARTWRSARGSGCS